MHSDYGELHAIARLAVAIWTDGDPPSFEFCARLGEVRFTSYLGTRGQVMVEVEGSAVALDCEAVLAAWPVIAARQTAIHG